MNTGNRTAYKHRRQTILKELSADMNTANRTVYKHQQQTSLKELSADMNTTNTNGRHRLKKLSANINPVKEM